MKTWTLPIALAGCLSLAGIARADQCVEVTPEIAQRAVQELQMHPRFVKFCEPCHEAAPGVPDLAVTATAEYDGGTADHTRPVTVNGLWIDLAYTYVQTSPDRYENLAMLAGCPVTGVSPSLRVEQETAGGVLITADSTPVTRERAGSAPVVVPVPVAAPQVAPAPAAAPPPAPTVYVVAAPEVPGWLVILLACGGAAAASAGWLAWLLVIGSRRRRAGFTPRALGLRDRE